MDQWKKDLIELLDQCVNFELRISILEDNSNDNFKTLFKLIDNIQNQPENPKMERRITTLLETVKKFNETLETKDDDLESDIKIMKEKMELMQCSDTKFEKDLNTLKGMIETVQNPYLKQIDGKLEYALNTNRDLVAQVEYLFKSQHSAPPPFPAAPVPPQQIVTPVPISTAPPLIPVPQVAVPSAGIYPQQSAFPDPSLITNSQPQYVQLPPVSTNIFNSNLGHLMPFTSQKTDNVPSISMTFPEEKYSLLVGKAGETINNIREASGAAISINLKDKTDKLYYEVVINGSEYQVKKAKFMIDKVIGESFPQENSDKSIITDREYSLLVLNEGSRINCIRNTSGARVTIFHAKDRNNSRIKHYEVLIGGTDSQVSMAKEMLKSVVDPFNIKVTNDAKETKSSFSKCQFNFGVQVDCEDPTLKDCQCHIHNISGIKYNIYNNPIPQKVELKESDFGKKIIENVEKSLGLPENGFKSTKAVLYLGSFLSCELQIDLTVEEVSKLQIEFKNLCSAAIYSNNEFPILWQPAMITNHKLMLTYVQTFNQDKSQRLILNKSNLKMFFPLFTLPKVSWTEIN